MLRISAEASRFECDQSSGKTLSTGNDGSNLTAGHYENSEEGSGCSLLGPKDIGLLKMISSSVWTFAEYA